MKTSTPSVLTFNGPVRFYSMSPNVAAYVACGLAPVWLPSFLSPGIATHLDGMGVVNQPVNNAIGQREIAELLVPTQDRQLALGNHSERTVETAAGCPVPFNTQKSGL